jgi:hypothetical protein
MALLTHPHHPHLAPTSSAPGKPIDLWATPRHWLDHIEVKTPKLAHLICRLIPSSCPFEREVNLWGRTLHIPALCHLNPVYNELMGLRFRALTYLAEELGEDISPYISG